MSPSASFGDNDGLAGYEPTMSPGAFQAAMAAGILAAQGATAAGPRQAESRVCQPDATPQRSTASAFREANRELPVPSTVRTGAGPQDNPPTPSSVASNSAVSLPVSRPDLSASFSSADAASRCQAATATPVSKPTEAAGIAISLEAAEEAAEDPASPSAEMSTNASADSVRAELHTVNASLATDEADSCKPPEPSHASLKLAQAQPHGSETVTSVPSRETAHSQTPGTPTTAGTEPASTQLAEIASGQADDSELSTAVKPAADDAESAPPLPAAHVNKGADSHTASTATNAGNKSLFSAVSKRPAEVGNMTLCSPAKAWPGHRPINRLAIHMHLPSCSGHILHGFMLVAQPWQQPGGSDAMSQCLPCSCAKPTKTSL